MKLAAIFGTCTDHPVVTIECLFIESIFSQVLFTLFTYIHDFAQEYNDSIIIVHSTDVCLNKYATVISLIITYYHICFSQPAEGVPAYRGWDQWHAPRLFREENFVFHWLRSLVFSRWRTKTATRKIETNRTRADWGKDGGTKRLSCAIAWLIIF